VTGSGKTIAYLLPTIQILLGKDKKWKRHEIGALVIAPTRELAKQIDDVLSLLLKHTPSLSHVLFIGGTSVQADIDNFAANGANIVIATPGRLHDILLRKTDSRVLIAVKHLEVLVLDEADCLLNLGFEQTLNAILQILPKQRRTGLFSATQTTEVLKLIRAGLRNPVSVVVRDQNQKNRVPATLENFYVIAETDYKFQLLLDFIKQKRKRKILIFFCTCACVEYFTLLMERFLVDRKVMSLHGRMKEDARITIFEKFRDLDTGILCCTDVMARGIDITRRIHWVIQYDPPSNPTSFIHRAGRTARNGKEGKAILFLVPSETKYIDYIRVSQKVSLNHLDLSSITSELSVYESIAAQMRMLQLQDRAVFDKAMRAFVSYFKSYSKYECSLILQLKDLPLENVAKSYGLVKFPKISELWGKKPDSFEEVDVDINSIPYKDKARELSRQRKLTVFKDTGKWPQSGSKRIFKTAEPWSIAKDKKAKKFTKIATKKRKRAALTEAEN